MIFPRRVLPAVLLLGLTAAGCGAKTYPVQGTVVYDTGQPAVELAGGSVQFEAVDARRRRIEGTIDLDGTFRLGTHKPGDGAVIGTYRVAVMPPAGADSDGSNKALIDPAFQDATTSGIVVKVEAKENKVTLTVARPR